MPKERNRTAGSRDAGRTRRRRRVDERAYRELIELEEADIGAEGVAGEADEASGTLPDSVGGTTGTSGHAAGIQSPGASEPSIRGINPEEARRKVGRRRRKDRD